MNKATTGTYYQKVNWGNILRKVQHLGPLEFGAYMYLYAHYWETGLDMPDLEGGLMPIPKGGMMGGMMGGMSEPLYRVCRAHDQKERDAVDNVLAAFFTLDQDGWHHADLDAALKERKTKSLTNSKNGKIGVEIREAKRKQGMTDGICDGISERSSKTDALNSNRHIDLDLSKSDQPQKLSTQSTEQMGDKSFSVNSFPDGFNILHHLSDAEKTKGQDLARKGGWDFYELVNRYNAWVKDTFKALPRKPAVSFLSWLPKYIANTRLK